MSTLSVRKPFTGWHMTGILVGFFAIVMAVNFTMARLAFSTFGGKVVENSYVASQQYNDLLARAEAQDAMGWDEVITVDADRHVRLTITRQGKPLAISGVTATLSHPLGRVPAIDMHFVADGLGSMRSREALAPGRWRLDALVRHGTEEARYRSDVQ
ncbi:FixH family protein [Blastomonas sp. AAP53]|uniref:FixH family protein n=1 Tax=Blastomonas sp. AAP53 TaxID=1248760 RepID=UPI00036B8A3C|nr:FixH family protein [Blastomonas sp. AAP53]